MNSLLKDSLLSSLLKFFRKGFNDHSTLKLVGSSQAAVLWSPVFSQESNSNQLLQMAQASLGTLFLHICQNSIVKLLGVLHSIIVSTDTIILGPLHSNGLVQLHQSDRPVHFTISIAADTSRNSINESRVTISHFHIFHSDVFTSLQLDKILDTVDDTNTSIFHELSNIPSMEPSIIIKYFLGLIRHHVVSKRNTSSPGENFSTSKNLVSVDIVGIRAKVWSATLVVNLGHG
mmetsp:Transcript_24258/g.35941  ORF Transcript_24258/g.35941 Transcript_24258/m.35941 type:complete len:232 (-) Transcript_24258:940-1635(-)